VDSSTGCSLQGSSSLSGAGIRPAPRPHTGSSGKALFMAAEAPPSTSVMTGEKPPSTLASRKRQEAMAGLTFVTPAIAVLLLFMIIPLIFAFIISLTNWDGITPLSRGMVTDENPTGAFEFIGLQNYQRLLIEEGTRQRNFYTSLKNTVYYVLGVVPLQTFAALGLAVILNQKWLKRKGFYRTAYYFPSITSSVVISLIFMWMFTTSGLINQFIGAIFPNYDYVNWLNNPNGLIHLLLGAFGITRETVGPWAQTEVASITLWNWISGPSVTMFMIMMLNVWTTIGTMMIIYLAALQNIPSQVYEAAIVDGATGWQIFRKITVPLLRGTTFFVVTIGLIGAFQVFDQVFVITNGGPANTTLTIAYLVYSSAFTDARMGLASATAVVLFLIIFVFTIVQRRLVGERASM
jgi:multiple sugar transport system permease protein